MLCLYACLGVLGMDPAKVSVMAGSFGVGIGFGLQSVVNNFVCGLILLNIPNAQFITTNVTNLTYSDRLRCIDLPVGVGCASAPNQVIELLREVADGNPHVLQNPPPICLFIS